MPRPIDAEIIDFIIDHVEAHPGDIGPLTTRRFGVTRATASNYLRRLALEGKLTAEGRTRRRRYALKTALHLNGMARIGPGAEDDEIWRRSLQPKLEGLARNVADICQYGFTAAVANVIDHSGGESFSWRMRLNAKSVELSVFDDGVGVFARIRDGVGLEDERRALLELSKGGLSTAPRRHAGLGLFFASRLFDSFRLASGELAYQRTRQEEDRWLVRAEPLAAPTAGTAVTMSVDLASKRQPGEVFASYAGPGGRPRTEASANLAAFAEASLTSRSQARRLTAGLERFAEAIIDFEGVEVVGPEFLHEVFVVFAAAHPQTRLVPLHASARIGAQIGALSDRKA